jgi:hypothetical protein
MNQKEGSARPSAKVIADALSKSATAKDAAYLKRLEAINEIIKRRKSRP